MEKLVFYLVAFGACIIGKICGMGGGVIIKPVLDAFGVMSVSSINFLSGCTVLGMTMWSVGKSTIQKTSSIDWKVSTPLAIGAAIGGIAGKELYSSVAASLPNPDMAGGVQAACLFAATLATLIYTIRKSRVKSFHVTNAAACVLIGLALGMLGAFLGIGGGPFNMAALFLFFSMDTRTAAQNSLYIILISQLASLLRTILSGSIPQIAFAVLVGMVICGVAGSEVGGRINRKLSDRSATHLFEGAMLLVMGINIYNMFQLL